MTQGPICPRCTHYIPNDENPGAYPGAISRVDNKTEICSKCGSDEAVQSYFNYVYSISEILTPISEWPIKEV